MTITMQHVKYSMVNRAGRRCSIDKLNAPRVCISSHRTALALHCEPHTLTPRTSALVHGAAVEHTAVQKHHERASERAVMGAKTAKKVSNIKAEQTAAKKSSDDSPRATRSTKRERASSSANDVPEREEPTSRRSNESDDGDDRETKRRCDAVGAAQDAVDKDDVKTLVRIDGNAGRVIGKGGETVRYIETVCEVRVEFRRDEGVAVVTPRADFGGTREEKLANTRRAKALIEEVANTGHIMERLTAEAPVGVNAGMRMDESVIPAELLRGEDDDELEFQIPCPGKEGRVIGRGAATIREISARSGASCHVVRGSGVCVAKGKRKCVRVAYQMVHDTLELQVDRFGVATDGTQLTQSQPQIGITHPPTSAMMYPPQGQPGQVVRLQGLPQGAVVINGMTMVPLSSIGLAPAPVANPVSTGLDTTIEVPCAGSEGRIVGKGGEMIKHLRAVTGCMVDIKNNKSPSAVVVISGTPYNAELCRSYVYEVMENGDTRALGKLGGAPHQGAPPVQQLYQQQTQYYAPPVPANVGGIWNRYYDGQGKPYEHNPVTNETRWV